MRAPFNDFERGTPHIFTDLGFPQIFFLKYNKGNYPPTYPSRRCLLNRRNSLALSVFFAFLIAVSGCQKPADQSAAPNTASSDTSSSSSSPANSSSVREAVAPKPLIVPAATRITVVLDEPLGSKTSTTGQNFSATVSSPIEVHGEVAVPKGARATGVVRNAKSAGRFKGGAVLTISLVTVTVGDATYDLHAASRTQTSTGKGKRSATMIGGGGAAGALIGGLAGGGKGAAIGALVGAGGGAAGAGLTGNREIVLPAETPLSFKLSDALEIKPKP
jgi:hypothetical protein